MTGELKGIKVVSRAPGNLAGVPCCPERIRYVNLHVLEPAIWKNIRKDGDVGDGPYRYPDQENSRYHPRFSENFNSGDKLCYQQMLGQTNGCHLQDIKYGCEAPDNEIVIQTQSWGQCARNCAPPLRGDCHFWTWSSSACSNCNPGECKLMRCSDLSNTLDWTGHWTGHISGERACQDIQYVETNEDLLVGVPGTRVGEPGYTWGWRDGKCREEGGAEPNCPALEVPGFRC